MGVWIVAWSPETGTIPCKAPVVDVDGSNAEAVPGYGLEVAHHVGHASVASNVDALSIRIGQLGSKGWSQAKAERGDIAPTQETTRNQGLVDRANLVAGVPGVTGDKRFLGIKNFHQVAIHPVGVDRLLIGLHQGPEPGQACFFPSLDLVDEFLVLTYTPTGLGRQLLYQSLKREFGIANQGVIGLVTAVDVQCIDRALDNSLLAQPPG